MVVRRLRLVTYHRPVRHAVGMLALMACSLRGSDLVVDRVEPASGPATATTAVRIEGTGFDLPLQSDLDEGGTVVGAMSISVGDVALADAVWRDEQLIEATIPAGLPFGRHDVRVTLGNRSGVLAEGYLVTGGVTSCASTFIDVCMQPAPTMSIDISGAETINTDTDPRCTTLVQASGGPVCLVNATTVNITSTGSLTATGSRPLAISSSSTMMIAGMIDVSSRRVGGQRGPASDDAACTFAAVPEEDAGGGGGAAGGSFGAKGGDGGVGDTDNSIGADGTAAAGLAGPVAMPTVLRGGCRGQTGGPEGGGGLGGTGGHSGGGLYLYAIDRIELSGRIRATGAGGEGGQVQAGGGGGGSGGLVVIESMTIAVSGEINANGGGGGEGGARVGSTPVSGQPGVDATFGTTPAPGGVGTDNRFGFGGAGGAGTTPAATATSSGAAGGGGGGGVGVIRLLGTTMVTGVVSPPSS